MRRVDMVRAGAAAFALYLMYRGRKPDDPLLWAALIILGLVAYTWIRSKRTIEPGMPKRARDTDMTPEERKCDTSLTIMQGQFPNCWQVTAYTIALRCLYDELPDEVRDHILNNYVGDEPNAKRGVCYIIPKSIQDVYELLFPLDDLHDPRERGGSVERLLIAILFMCGYREGYTVRDDSYITYGEVDPGPGLIPYPYLPRQMIQVNYNNKYIYGFDQIYKDIEHLFERSDENPYGIDGGWVYVEIIDKQPVLRRDARRAHAIPFTVCRQNWFALPSDDDYGLERFVGRWKIILCNQHNMDCSDGALKKYLYKAKQGDRREIRIKYVVFLAGKEEQKGTVVNPIKIPDANGTKDNPFFID